MSVFGPFLDDANIRSVLKQCVTAAGRLSVVAAIRANVIAQLSDLAKRVPVVPPRLNPSYLAQGKPVPTWSLDSDDQVIEFCLTARQMASKDELRALDLLRACVAAKEHGDVAPLADEALGVATRGANRRRRKGKPEGNPHDTGRDDRLRKYHARLRADGAHDPTSATAVEFGLSTRRVREILAG